MNPIILTIIALLVDHLDKIVMLLRKGTYIKRLDEELLGQLVIIVNRYEDKVLSKSVIEMIPRWSNKKNKNFAFHLNLIRVSKLKISIREQQIKQLLKLVNTDSDNSLDNLYTMLFIYFSLSLILHMAIKAVDISNVGNNLSIQVIQYQILTYLVISKVQNNN